jgi:hypothetical protein
VTAEVDAAVEAEWNRWYGRRYISSGEITESAADKTERKARRIYTTAPGEPAQPWPFISAANFASASARCSGRMGLER